MVGKLMLLLAVKADYKIIESKLRELKAHT